MAGAGGAVGQLVGGLLQEQPCAAAGDGRPVIGATTDPAVVAQLPHEVDRSSYSSLNTSLSSGGLDSLCPLTRQHTTSSSTIETTVQQAQQHQPATATSAITEESLVRRLQEIDSQLFQNMLLMNMNHQASTSTLSSGGGARPVIFNDSIQNHNERSTATAAALSAS
eukprot:GSA120T00021816001.1